MKAGSKGSTAIPSDPHRMVSATCPAVATSGRLMILWKNVKQGEGRGGEEYLTVCHQNQDLRWYKEVPLYCEQVDHHWSLGVS